MARILRKVYSICDYDAVYVICDFNARIWSRDDYTPEIDNVQKQQMLKYHFRFQLGILFGQFQTLEAHSI